MTHELPIFSCSYDNVRATLSTASAEDLGVSTRWTEGSLFTQLAAMHGGTWSVVTWTFTFPTEEHLLAFLMRFG